MGATTRRCLVLSVCVHLVEIYFGILQRKVLAPAAAHDLSELERRILAFEARSRAQPRPFAWRFARVQFQRRLHELAA